WQQQLRMHNTYYGDPWYDGYYVDSDGWDFDQGSREGPYHAQQLTSTISADSGSAGGWFSGIGDFFSDMSSGEGGSGDGGGGDGGGGSSCGSCGGGGCGGGD